MIPEIYCLYIAIAVHTVFYGCPLRVLDVKKDGGNWKDVLPFQKTKIVETVSNDDIIEDEDEDVKKERASVADYMSDRLAPSKLPVIAVHNLRKVYSSGEKKKNKCVKKPDDSKTKVAVRNLSLSVESGEVFGLLGHNGAGKTTTMRIIIAEEAATAGQVRQNL